MRSRRLTALLTATCAAVPLAVAAAAPAAAATAEDPVSLVNTFVGSANGGNTFPGASAPFGMTQVSPVGSYFAGWKYDDTKIKGFGHTFVSGAGCWEQGGQVSALPTTGAVGPGAAFDTSSGQTFDQNNYAADYTHDGEVGRAGYYRTRLTSYGGITVESTADVRTSVERYTYPASKNANVFVNTGQADDLHKVVASDLQVVDDHTLAGEVRTQSFCGGAQYSTWFRMSFDRPFTSFGTWTPDGGTPGSRDSGRGESLEGLDLRGGWVSFDTTQDRDVQVTTSISQTGPSGALANLRAEGERPDGRAVGFDRMQRRAEGEWRRVLGRVQPQGGTRDQRAVFTTALYHTFLQPNTASDVDGRYRGFDDKIHVAHGWTYHEFFSLWDTYRAQNQLLAMIMPSVAHDIGRSLLAIDQQGGWLPRWAYATFDTNTQTGDPVTPYLVDLWRYGVLGDQTKAIYQALRRNVDSVPPAGVRTAGRVGNPSYLKNGYIAYDPSANAGLTYTPDPVYAGSATEEYALADCSLSQMAAGLGHAADAQRLAARGGNWASVWNPAVSSEGFTGFPEARNADGSWVPTDPTNNENGFQEGTPWQYQWLAQQDVPGMTAAMGGTAKTVQRLDTFFDLPSILASPTTAARKSWVVGALNYDNAFRYNPNNEPDLHAPSLYAYLGQPAKTSAVMRAAQSLYTNTTDGITGNDDLGTMSAWYVLSAMGVYPGVPGTGELIFSAPLFPLVTVRPENGRRLDIVAPGANGTSLQYIDKLTYARGGHAGEDRSWTTWDRLSRAGRVDVQLTSNADTSWARSATPPTSPCAGQGRPAR